MIINKKTKYLANFFLFSLFKTLPIPKTIIKYNRDRELANIQSLDMKGMA
jgi:hypothetical protein